mmetsp:Transcript_63488/g.168218  ORF Transcript_63488/g.168218 Transcript_63488/m.168218 type:complete len:218 (-) Transcript_63488:879-1532(-)
MPRQHDVGAEHACHPSHLGLQVAARRSWDSNRLAEEMAPSRGRRCQAQVAFSFRGLVTFASNTADESAAPDLVARQKVGCQHSCAFRAWQSSVVSTVSWPVALVLSVHTLARRTTISRTILLARLHNFVNHLDGQGCQFDTHADEPPWLLQKLGHGNCSSSGKGAQLVSSASHSQWFVPTFGHGSLAGGPSWTDHVWESFCAPRGICRGGRLGPDPW